MKLKVMSPKLQRHGCYKYSDVCQTCVPLHLIQCSCLMSCGWKHKNSSMVCVCVAASCLSNGTNVPRRQLPCQRCGKHMCFTHFVLYQVFLRKKKKSLPFFPRACFVWMGLSRWLFFFFLCRWQIGVGNKATWSRCSQRIDFLNWSVSGDCADTSRPDPGIRRICSSGGSIRRLVVGKFG